MWAISLWSIDWSPSFVGGPKRASGGPGSALLSIRNSRAQPARLTLLGLVTMRGRWIALPETTVSPTSCATGPRAAPVLQISSWESLALFDSSRFPTAMTGFSVTCPGPGARLHRPACETAQLQVQDLVHPQELQDVSNPARDGLVFLTDGLVFLKEGEDPRPH